MLRAVDMLLRMHGLVATGVTGRCFSCTHDVAEDEGIGHLLQLMLVIYVAGSVCRWCRQRALGWVRCVFHLGLLFRSQARDWLPGHLN